MDPNSPSLIDSLHLERENTVCIKGKPNMYQRRRENLIVHLVNRINEHLAMNPGVIVVFVPGPEEVHRLSTRLEAPSTLPAAALSPTACGPSPKAPAAACLTVLPVPCYETLRLLELHQIFESTPAGHRKVVLTPRFAECSFHIDGVTHVIDSGLLRENWYSISMETLSFSD